MVRPTLRLAVFLLFVLTAVWIWTVVPRDEAARPSGPPAPLRVIIATPLDGGGTRLVVRALGVMGTEVTLTLFGEDETALRDASTVTFERIESLEARFSRWRPKSDVSRVNAGAGDPVGVHAGTHALIRRALALGRRTGGAFDVTVGPLIRFWRDRETYPTDEEIAQVTAYVGLDRVTLAAGEPPTVCLAAGSRLDLGGIAKGAIVDAAGRVLAERGVTSFLVNAGGDLLGHGPGPRGSGLLTALRDPGAGTGTTLPRTRIRLRDAALCTSGSYERFREIEGIRVSHIVDPRTGRPIEDTILQASVLASDCETADALATALMVLGAEDGLRIIGEMDGVEALLVVRGPDGPEIRESAGFDTFRVEDER